MSKPEAKALVMENTSRRDELIAIEKKYQKLWQQDKVFEVDAPQATNGDYDALHKKYPKFFATMAYPYMNGVLHAGHSFTLSKVEFATGYERMQGKRALFPLGFHCTGMPIRASADKLAREIEQFGENFEDVPADNDESEGVIEEVKTAGTAAKTDPSKFGTKKSKAMAKQGRAKYQHEIMIQLGIPREDVKKFADPNYWLEFFPPLCQRDCDLFGARIDWRRSMITTDVNPYYDSFVRWQLTRLKELGKIKFGERYTIYSAKDGQPCMDHDRQVGEGVNPQEYTGIKIEVLKWTDAGREAVKGVDLEGKKVFLVAATLRPETMYGQTCCFVSPKIDYGLFDAGNNEIYICTQRSFKNMCYQNLTPKRGVYDHLAEVNGAALVGSTVKAPLSVYPEVFVLPMETVLAKKGTGVVTSVPSDSPDDFITMQDLRNKPEYYKVDKKWVEFDPVEIIDTPTYGTHTAEKVVEELKIKSPKDRDALAKAKEIAYKEGFFQGTMAVGKYKGEKVETAKPKVREDLVAAGEAFVYSEPEGLVISRSGDECIVSLEDQWFTDYGEDTWRGQAEKCLRNMETYSNETRHGFEKVLGWLRNWALSRTYGLGSHIPWDEKYLCESLSDSTIYMAYYTVSHFLHADFYGREAGTLDIAAADMTEEVWDYVFNLTDDLPKESKLPAEKLNKMRNEFAYFYPLDVRVSGKDLIPNHLTFFIYVHTAIFPEKYWPQGVRANGHLMLNNEKMSKSTGNFLTLKESVEKFGADATRIALADAGDSFEDANFDESNANAAILRLYNLKEWIEEIVKAKDTLRKGPATGFLDLAFENEMNELIEQTKDNYDNALYRYAIKTGLFDFLAARDYYRETTAYTTTGPAVGMHHDLIFRYIEVQVLLLAPIAPHFAEYVWRELLGKKDSIQNAAFPTVSKPVSKSVSAALAYVRDVSRAIREVEGANLKKKKKGPEFDPKTPSKLTLYVALSFPQWQDQYIDLVRETYQQDKTLTFTPEFKQQVSKLGDVKRGMQFINHLKMRLSGGGESPETVFNRKLVFDEKATVQSVLPLINKSPAVTVVESVQIVLLEGDDRSKGKDASTGEVVEVNGTSKPVQDAVPGSPGITIVNLAK